MNGVLTSNLDVHIKIGFVIVNIYFSEYTGVGKGQWPSDWCSLWSCTVDARMISFQTLQETNKEEFSIQIYMYIYRRKSDSGRSGYFNYLMADPWKVHRPNP